MMIVYLLIIVLFLAALGAMLIGLPGNWFIIVLTALFAFLTDWQILSLTETAILVACLLSGEILETLLALKGANKYKPSKWTYVATVIGAVAGAIIGTSILPLIGSVIGAAAGVFVGTYAVESYLTGNSDRAEQVAKSAMIGSLIGMSMKFAIAFGVICYIFWSMLAIHIPAGAQMF